MKKSKTFIILTTILLSGVIAFSAFATDEEGNINLTNKYAWSENAGWQNYRPSYAGGYVNRNYLTGYIWCENTGWVHLGAAATPPGGAAQWANTDETNYGVNNDGSGNLSGYAWSENAGWINFNSTHSQVTIDTSTGEFDGYGWSENLGWVHFKNASPAYNVQTNWPTITWDGSASGDWGTAANWDSGAVPSGTENVVIPDASTTPNDPTVSSGAVCANLTIQSGGVLNNGSNTLTVSGSWANSGTFNPGTGGVLFNATSGTITIATNLCSFNNLSFNDSGNTATFQLSEATDVNGNFTLTDGIFDRNGKTLTVGGNWAFAGGSFASAPSVTFDTQATETTISGETTFNNLSCTTAGKTIKFTQGTNQTVNGTLTMTGGSGAGEKVTLHSTVDGQKWDITLAGGAQTVTYANVQDSDANTNTVTAYNSTDSGNNNTNWIFSDIAITSPEGGKTVGTTPVVIGTAGADDEVVIKDKNGTEVATTTADANGNFRVAVSTALAIGLNNSLTPYVGVISGTTISVDVVASPATNQVPTITSPTEDQEISGATPTITGKGLAGQTVTLTANDENGNLLLTNVATATVDASGDYTISSSDYTTNLAKGTNYLTITVDGVTSSIRTVSLTDPFGVVFDSVSNNPIGGATVTIYNNATGNPCTPGVEIAAADANPQTTGADGTYSFLCANGNYYIAVSASGYTYPSGRTSFPAGRTVVNGSKGEVFAVAGVVIEMDHPMDSSSTLLKITKDANKKDVVVGDIVTYTITIENSTASDITNVYLEDKIPAGFKYLSGKVRLDGQSLADPTGNRPLTFNIGTVSAGTTRTLKYQLVVGSGVTFGKYENRAFAKYSDGTVISNTATEEVKVIKDPLFDLGTIIGKVFWDWDENGIQRSEDRSQKSEVRGQRSEVRGQMAEVGVGGVRIVMEDGTVIVTDKDGKYHVPGVIPGRHAFRLDESTLPDGAYLTTPKVVIEDVREGLTSKVNFGVSAEDKSPVASHQSPVKITKEHGLPKPRLNVALNDNTLEVRDVGGLKEAATFKIFTNYSLFIDKWQLDVFDKTTKRLFKRFEGGRKTLSESIIWNGMDDRGNMVRPDRAYTYVLTVWDKQGKFDKTRERVFKAVRYDESRSKKEELEKEIFGETETEEDIENFWRGQSKVNNLKQQSIRLEGETVKVMSQMSEDRSQGLEVRSIKIMKDGKLVGEIPVRQKKVTAKELLEKPQFEPESETEPIEIIVPNGEYEVQVVSQRTEDPEGKPSASYGAGKGQKAEIGEYLTSDVGPLTSDIRPLTSEIYSKHIKVGEDYFFFIAMADGEMGYNFIDGATEPIEDNDRFKKGLWLEGKLAYYLKAKIKGKYLITSSLDTQRDQKELFRYIDPDKYYPVYGDESQISYEATNTQGMLYAMIEWDRSEVMWGNYNVAFTDTEFARFSRTLYGGKAELISTSDTKFGEPNTKLITFMAKAKQKAAHNEFVGTGGSLYYLKHKYIVEGSDKVKIEVRDKITGLVLSTLEQKEGSDYQIDYDNGRITFWKPISQIAESESIISTHLLDGNKLYVVADYEYYTKDKYDKWSKGARVSQQLSDYLRIGGTYVQDENQAKKNYELKGVDTTLRLGDDIKFDAEYAETKSEEGNNFISTDGGLSFDELATSETAKGKAYGLKGEARLFDRLGLSGYYKKAEKGFSTPSSIANQGTEKMGGAASLEIVPQTTISARHDIQKLLDDGSLEARAQVGAEKTETTTVQLQSQLTEKLEATAEYRRQQVSGKKELYESETNEDTDIIAGRLAYKVTDKTIVSLKHQESLSGEKNRQSSVGAETMLTEHIGLRAEGMLGSKGNAATAGINANVEDRLDLFADYTLSNEIENGRGRTVTAGGKVKVDDKSSLYNTYSVSDSEKGKKRETAAFGAKKELDEGYEITMGMEFSKEGEKLASANTYGVAKEIEGKRIEGTFKQETANDEGNASITNIFGLSGDINDKWAGSFNFEKGRVQNLDGTQTKRIAASGGLSYVDKDKIKASSKLEFRHDDAAEDSWQILAYNAVEGKISEDLTLFGKANVSHTENTSANSTLADFKELVAGAAYRPIYHDKLNLIGKYTFLEDNSPTSQSDFKDIDHIKAHVFGLEAVYDLTDKFQIVEKGAFKHQDEKVSGFDFTKTQTWLLVNRLNYNLNKDWELGGEYRILNVVQAEDLKQGALVEVSRRIGEYVKVGAGYNFTDFSDDLTDLDYTVHGPFVRMTGVLYDRSPEEVERARKKELKKNIEKWAWELVHNELARPEGEVMKELYNYFYLAQTAYDEGRLKQAKELYGKIQEAGKKMYEEALEYVRNRVELEKRLKNYNELARIYYKEGRIIEAKELWQKIITESKQEVSR